MLGKGVIGRAQVLSWMDGAGGGHERNGEVGGGATKGGYMGRRAAFGPQESMVGPDSTSRRGETVLVGGSGRG